jgi:hypothetical protein
MLLSQELRSTSAIRTMQTRHAGAHILMFDDHGQGHHKSLALPSLLPDTCRRSLSFSSLMVFVLCCCLIELLFCRFRSLRRRHQR